MKLQYVLSAVLLLAGGSANAQNTVSVKGQVVGMTDSCMVTLTDVERKGETKRLGSVKFKGEQFAFNAELAKSPRFAELTFSVKGKKDGWMKTTTLQLMLDGSPVSVKIAKDLMENDSLYRQRKQTLANKGDGLLSLDGGKMQQQYAEYLDFMTESSVKADSASYAEANAWFASNGDNDAIKDYKERAARAEAERDAKRNEFIETHPESAVSAALVAQYAFNPFSYSVEQFDKQYALLANNPDTTHVNFIKKNLTYFRTHAKGAMYTDFSGETKEGKTVSLSSLLKPGKMMLIDFWASWCGPCRSAIPKVKAMAKEYAGKLEVLSCSVDEKKDAWLKAEKEEAMPWTQLWLPMSKLKDASSAYSIYSIPRLVLIGTGGKVVCITHDPSIIKQNIK